MISLTTFPCRFRGLMPWLPAWPQRLLQTKGHEAFAGFEKGGRLACDGLPEKSFRKGAVWGLIGALQPLQVSSFFPFVGGADPQVPPLSSTPPFTWKFGVSSCPGGS